MWRFRFRDRENFKSELLQVFKTAHRRHISPEVIETEYRQLIDELRVDPIAVPGVEKGSVRLLIRPYFKMALRVDEKGRTIELLAIAPHDPHG
jgi:hypothetical protein